MHVRLSRCCSPVHKHQALMHTWVDPERAGDPCIPGKSQVVKGFSSNAGT